MDNSTAGQDIAGAISLLERANEKLQPGEMSRREARSLLDAYSRIVKLGGYGVAALSPSIGDPSTVARASGTSLGKARDAVATGSILRSAPELGDALSQGTVSLDEAAEIARAEEAAPGSARTLVKVAQDEAFHVLKDQARKVKLEAEQHRDLAAFQHQARRARSHVDPLGMVHIRLELQPHVGAPIVARAEAQAQRLARAAKAAAKHTGKSGPAGAAGSGGPVELEPFERHLADAYALLLAGAGKGRARRPELTVLVSHSVAKRGWTDVRPGEMCKIPGVGPVAPDIAKAIAADAFLNGVFFDGKDLRHFKRWSRDISVEVRAALELGQPPDFDGIRCRDCGNHFRTEFDHVDPHVAHGPASTSNLEPRCWPCHQAKTARDRKAGKLKPPRPP
ncbi:MAG: HNH endonuclease signature motif containing protein [Actinomycetota bacterium]